jgi:hypothetical protein
MACQNCEVFVNNRQFGVGRSVLNLTATSVRHCLLYCEIFSGSLTGEIQVEVTESMMIKPIFFCHIAQNTINKIEYEVCLAMTLSEATRFHLIS